MNDKVDDNKYFETLLELDSLMGDNSCRTPECPDEVLYWSIFDDENRIPPEFQKHLLTCKYCRRQLALISKAIATVDTASLLESQWGKGALEEKMKAPPLLSIQLGEAGLSPLLNSFGSSQPYRSTNQENITFAEQTSFGIFEISFVQSERREFVEVMVRIRKPKKPHKTFIIELRRESNILRSIPLEIDQWSSASQWPKGIYYLTVNSVSVDQLTLEIRLV